MCLIWRSNCLRLNRQLFKSRTSSNGRIPGIEIWDSGLLDPLQRRCDTAGTPLLILRDDPNLVLIPHSLIDPITPRLTGDIWCMKFVQHLRGYSWKRVTGKRPEERKK